MSTDILLHLDQTITPAQKLAVGRFLALCYARTWPEEPTFSAESEAERLSAATSETWKEMWAVFASDAPDAEALAFAELNGNRTHNTHHATFHLLVHPDYEAQNDENADGPRWRKLLLERMQAAARELGVAVLGTWGLDRLPLATAFLQANGFRLTLNSTTVRLRLQDVQGELLQAWQARPAHDPYKLHRWTRVPDEYLERMADLKATINDMPRGESEAGELVYTPQNIREQEAKTAAAGETRFLVVVEDTRTGQLVAFSETYWGPQRAATVYQGGTAVRRECRGHGLGKWVKAAMFVWLREVAVGARHIRTTVADENGPMNALNARLGFVPHAVMTEWELCLPAKI